MRDPRGLAYTTGARVVLARKSDFGVWLSTTATGRSDEDVAAASSAYLRDRAAAAAGPDGAVIEAAPSALYG